MLKGILIFLLVALLVAHELVGAYRGADNPVPKRNWLAYVISLLLIIFVYLVSLQIANILKGA